MQYPFMQHVLEQHGLNPVSLNPVGLIQHGLIQLSSADRKLSFVTRLAPLLTALLLLTLSAAQNAPLHKVPSEFVQLSGEAISIDTGAVADTFIAGLGWLSGSGNAPPVRGGDSLYVDEATRQRFGLEPNPVAGIPAPHPDERAGDAGTPGGPLSANIRFGGRSEIRVVLDLFELPDAAALRRLEGRGMLGEGEQLRLELPRITDLPSPADPYHGVEVNLRQAPGGTQLELSGPPASYHVFTLETPTRLVIDLLPRRPASIPTRVRRLREGVTYRTFGAPTPAGQSLVHLLEIAPDAGEFRVVGTTEVARTLSELADGAFAAINAGYFDTGTFQAIGLLRVDYGLQSMPSRNRASVGFGFAGPVMTRVTAEVDVRIAGRIHRRNAPGGSGSIQVHTAAGASVGNGRNGALVAQHGRIIANRIGPVTVPPNGFVLVYPPDDREFALIEPGAPASIEVDFEPDSFQAVRYAVEAGPLLLKSGLPAFEPDREAFSRGDRILDAYTQQSAIGIRPDGTVLFLVADNMRAEDLIPLFLALGASDAMRLDSGSSATLFAGGQVLNRNWERRIVSAIVFLPTGSL